MFQHFNQCYSNLVPEMWAGKNKLKKMTFFRKWDQVTFDCFCNEATLDKKNEWHSHSLTVSHWWIRQELHVLWLKNTVMMTTQEVYFPRKCPRKEKDQPFSRLGFCTFEGFITYEDGFIEQNFHKMLQHKENFQHFQVKVCFLSYKNVFHPELLNFTWQKIW